MTLEEIQRAAEYKYPILRTHCRLERRAIEEKRRIFIERLKKENGLT